MSQSTEKNNGHQGTGGIYKANQTKPESKLSMSFHS